MGDANKRGTFEQRKNNPKIMSQETQPMDLEKAPMEIAGTINKCIMGGVPIPFILSTLVLIQHDLAGKHIERTNAMHKLAEASKKEGSVTVSDNSEN